MHQVLARKFRPTQFDDVIGQAHITRPLQNAIKAGRTAHAYLFSGSRGVGKTTTARILASALNCDKGMSANPCGSCASCIEIHEGRSLDVIEVDGASNNGVEDIRQLTDTVKYNPTQGKHKIYIIDEVHMLTTPAFNALLKTLEEPPPGVLFIFATTEAHKVLETIRSRCQQYSFSLIPDEIIIKRLQALLQREDFKADGGALEVVARAAGGSMRDAESILEKVMTYAGSPIKTEQALAALGLVAREVLLKVAHAVAQGDAFTALQTLSDVIQSGRNLHKFIQELLATFRNLLLLNLNQNLQDTLDCPQTEIPQLLKISQGFNEKSLLMIMEVLMHLEMDMRLSSSPRIQTEMALIRCCRARELEPLDQLLKKVQNLQSRNNPTRSSQPSRAHPSASKASSAPLTLAKLTERWPDFLRYMEQKNPLLKKYLAEARLGAFQDERLTLSFTEPLVFHAKVLGEHDHHKFIAKELSSFFKHQFNFHIEVDATEELTPIQPSNASSANALFDTPSKKFLSDALDLFQGDVVSIKSDSHSRMRDEGQQLSS